MLRLTQIKLPLKHNDAELTQAIAQELGVKNNEIISYKVFRRGIDARNKKNIFLIYTVDVEVLDEESILRRVKKNEKISIAPDTSYKFPARAYKNVKERPIVVGMGPCGLFSGLILAELGFRPIILERGEIVRQRTKDTFALWRKSILNPNSNVQFGEGGAGTFSDGKLHSLVSDPEFRGRKVLTEFVEAGAPAEILYISKPHIGTLRLVSMVEKMRAKILSLGGEIRFGAKVETLLSRNQQISGVKLSNGEQINSHHVVIALGHSARESFKMLNELGVYMEAKPFSIGFRVEHPQSMIDACKYGAFAKNPLLGAADYKLVHHCANGRSVYSFCMCPGGTVVAATSEVGHVVTNGMSQYSRVERNANSGIVVGINPSDYPSSVLAGIDLQRSIEQKAFLMGGSNYNAPAQLVGDFLANRSSTKLGDVVPSYKPGVKLTNLAGLLPDFATTAIREAILAFDKKIPGFARDDALFTAPETRTSSPVRIKRGEDFQSVNMKGLYPAGEGAGYAGGILSAAIDGLKVGEAVAKSMNS
ncbi:MAG: NAD(P)/FAD-dependent oxidoreductase [Myxococcales bacterium]|nr:NAD(P)/FAD-dependent oxidoreductase [Myxococcales bacterium]USN50662.1 MAG: NAD(P)/FAD-dependent oxidoreductase [Myxococcales bacterium]